MSIDYTPLLAPVNKHEVKHFRAQSRLFSAPWADTAFVATVVTVLGVVLLGVVSAGFVLSAASVFDSSPNNFISLLWLLFITAVSGLLIWLALVGFRTQWEKLLRRAGFAAANSLDYLPVMNRPDYPGMIFAIGSSRKAEHLYRGSGTRPFEMGNYSYTTGSGKNRETHNWGFLAVRLERCLPHMVLDARSNNSLFGNSNLPASFRRNQRLSLEGDFDKYFALYCPKEYERDAVYVFTPDLMALLIDHTATFDVEIVDDWMFVYSRSKFTLDKAETLERLFGILGTVGSKTYRQTDRYADERVGNRSFNLVAPQGRRLKTGFTFAGVGLLVVAGWVAFNFIRLWF